MNPTCENCMNRERCPTSINGCCERWEGDCDLCNIHGEQLFKEYCADCDWEEDDDC